MIAESHYTINPPLQLVAEREQVQKNRKQTHHIKQAMEGHVRHEKERFERLAKEMKFKEKDLAVKSDKLRQVQELIKNSPLVGTRSALRETATPNVKPLGKVGVGSCNYMYYNFIDVL